MDDVSLQILEQLKLLNARQADTLNYLKAMYQGFQGSAADIAETMIAYLELRCQRDAENAEAARKVAIGKIRAHAAALGVTLPRMAQCAALKMVVGDLPR